MKSLGMLLALLLGFYGAHFGQNVARGAPPWTEATMLRSADDSLATLQGVLHAGTEVRDARGSQTR